MTACDPKRAYELLPGKTRSSTLKRYVTMYKRWRLWLQEAKCVDPPGRPADLVEYLMVLRDEPCAWTVPDSLLKAISWMEKVAEFRVELRATGGRFAWAAKDKIVEALYEGAPLIRRAPRYPVMVLVAIERVVVDENELGQAGQGLGLAKVVGPPSHPPRRAEASGGPIGHHATPDQNVWTEQTHQGHAAMRQ